MLEMNSILDLHIVLMGYSLKANKEYKNSKKQGIQDIFIKMKYIKLLFNMTWLMEILKV